MTQSKFQIIAWRYCNLDLFTVLGSYDGGIFKNVWIPLYKKIIYCDGKQKVERDFHGGSFELVKIRLKV